MRGNVTSKGFIYLTKALCEIKSTNEVGRRIGLELSDEKDVTDTLCSPYDMQDTKVNTCYAMRPLEWLIQSLSNSHTEVGDETLVSHILLALAHLNHIIDRFENVGMSIDCDTFDGHFYDAISALSRALDYFCGIDSNDDKAHEPIDTVSLDNYVGVARDVTKKYSLAIRVEIKKIHEEW